MTSSAADAGADQSTSASGAKSDGSEFEQEDKPKVCWRDGCLADDKAAIAAEYLAHGYTIGDHIIQKAIDVDSGSWQAEWRRASSACGPNV